MSFCHSDLIFLDNMSYFDNWYRFSIFVFKIKIKIMSYTRKIFTMPSKQSSIFDSMNSAFESMNEAFDTMDSTFKKTFEVETFSYVENENGIVITVPTKSESKKEDFKVGVKPGAERHTITVKEGTSDDLIFTISAKKYSTTTTVKHLEDFNVLLIKVDLREESQPIEVEVK